MTRKISALLLAVAIGSGACSRSNSTPADSALASDLSLAQQQRKQFSIDSAEQAGELKAKAQHSATVASHAGQTHTSAGTVATTTSGGTVVKHTQRDAAIGAVAGAVIGATTSRNKVKGGVIGAAVGGILGGVVGNNVDKTKKKP